MNKIFKSFLIVATLAIVFGAVGSVYAQSTTPETPLFGEEKTWGSGIRGDRGMRAFRGEGTAPGTYDGVLHDALIAAFAEELGMEVDELESQILEGETMAEIALANGLTIDEFKDIMETVRTSVIDQAVSEGTLTQEQAEWMKTRGAEIGNNQGLRGKHQSQFNYADCPNNNLED